MSFLAPLFLAGAAAAAVPIVLHLFQRHTEQRIQFPAVALLKGAPVEHTTRRRLRELLLLALRAGALVLLALAFARPFFRNATTANDSLTVVAVDTSLSMSATATFARAKQMALDAVHQTSSNADVAVVTFADRAEVVVAPGAGRGAAESALSSVTPSFGSTNYADAFATASELFRGRSGNLIVVTDLQTGGWDAGSQAASIPQAVRVDVQDVGAPADNLAVESVRQDGDRVIAAIRNAAARARDVRARLTVDGRAAGQTSVSIDARGGADAVFAGVHSAGVAAVSVDDPAGIQGDNTRYALIGGDAPAASLVVTTSGDLDKDAWYVRHALASARGVAAPNLGATSADALNQAGAVVLLSTRGLEPRGREHLASFVHRGGGLLIAAGPDVDGEVVADVLGAAAALKIGGSVDRGSDRDSRRVALQDPIRLAPADVRHPIFRAFGSDVSSLGLVQFQTVAQVSGQSCQTIAQFTSGAAAMLDCVAGRGRAIVLASDLDNRWNDLPVHASFLPLVDQTVRYLAGNRYRGSEYLVSEVPPGTTPVPGVTTADTGAGSRRIIVNVDPKESSIERMTPAEFQASVTRLKDTAVRSIRLDNATQENRQHLWQYLIVAMLIALLAEGLVSARTT